MLKAGISPFVKNPGLGRANPFQDTLHPELDHCVNFNLYFITHQRP